jgi:type IX secretion system PorP/SprF family membrane protein
MNRFVFSILVLLFPLHLAGQVYPVTHHYIFDALAINPATAGCNNALSVTILYRNQWAGFNDAPKNQMLSVHAPLKNERIGLGLLIESNSIGIFKETNFIGNYAYRVELGNGRLAMGLGFGVTVHNIAWNELNAADPNDAQLMNNPSSAVLPNFSLGTYYYTKKYFFGISLPMFLSHDLDHSTGKYVMSNNFSGYNFLISGGYQFDLTQSIKLIPSLLIKYSMNNSVQADYYALLNLKDRICIGMGYRNENMLVGILQLQLNHQIRLGYSYDFELGSIGKYMNGSHEIVLSYLFRYERRVIGPRQF